MGRIEPCQGQELVLNTNSKTKKRKYDFTFIILFFIYSFSSGGGVIKHFVRLFTFVSWGYNITQFILFSNLLLLTLMGWGVVKTPV